MNASSNDQAKSDHSIHLFVEVKDGMVDAYAPVRWCICKSLLDQIRAERQAGRMPLLLMAVTYKGEEVDRKLIPLEQELEFFMFHRSGEHVIKAIIIFSDKPDATQKHIFERMRGGSSTHLLDKNGELSSNRILNFSQVVGCAGAGEIGVRVDKKFFSARPSVWLWNWTNYWFETEPRDQCQFRRRCMLAFSIQPVALLAWVVFAVLARSFAAVALRFGCGFRGVDFGPIFHPLTSDMDDVWCYGRKPAGTSVFSKRADGKDMPWFITACMPAIVLPFTLMIGLLVLFVMGRNAGASNSLEEMDFFFIAAISLGVYFGLLVAMWSLSFAGFIFLGTFLFLGKKIAPSLVTGVEKLGDALSLRRVKRMERWRIAQQETMERAYTSLVCTDQPQLAKFEALPPERKTFSLWFGEQKRKLCKPYPKKGE